MIKDTSVVFKSTRCENEQEELGVVVGVPVGGRRRKVSVARSSSSKSPSSYETWTRPDVDFRFTRDSHHHQANR